MDQIFLMDRIGPKGDQNELKCYADMAQYKYSSYKYYVSVFGYYIDGF